MTGCTLIRLSGWIEALNNSREGSGGAWWKKRRCELHFLERSQYRPFAQLVGARYHEHRMKQHEAALSRMKQHEATLRSIKQNEAALSSMKQKEAA